MECSGLVNEVVKRLEDAGLTIAARKELTATAEIAARHYPMDPDYLLTMGHVDPSGWTEAEKQERIAQIVPG